MSTRFLYIFLVSASCVTLPKQLAEPLAEQVRIIFVSYNIASNKTSINFVATYNVWYQDSLGITEVNTIKMVNNGLKDTLISQTIGYRFVDMRKNWIYEYRNLSDTAEIIKKYAKADSLNLSGGWNFYHRSIFQFDNLRAMRDTIIDGITYRKQKYVQLFQGQKLLGECLSRCDKKNSFFLMDEGLSKAVGCPVVKTTSLSADGKFPTSTGDIQFISNQFPESVQRVFVAWKRNVQLYPVE